MRTILFFLISLFSFPSFAQTNWSPAFPVKTSFEIGELQTYSVSELFRVDNLFLGMRSQVESTVNFQVFDTSDGGFWMSYSVKINSVKQRKDSSAFIIAQLVDGIQLFIYAKNGNLQLDSAFYYKTKNSVAEKLDSIAAQQTFGKKITQFIRYLQSKLKEDSGLGSFLTPLMAFEVYYSSNTYKKFRLTTEGTAQDILHKSLFSGAIEKEWISTSKDSNVRLNLVFIGDRTPVERYLKSFHESYFKINNIEHRKLSSPPIVLYIQDYTFRIKAGNSFPSYLYMKHTIEYFLRSVSKIEMKEIENE